MSLPYGIDVPQPIVPMVMTTNANDVDSSPKEIKLLQVHCDSLKAVFIDETMVPPQDPTEVFENVLAEGFGNFERRCKENDKLRKWEMRGKAPKPGHRHSLRDMFTRKVLIEKLVPRLLPPQPKKGVGQRGPQKAPRKSAIKIGDVRAAADTWCRVLPFVAPLLSDGGIDIPPRSEAIPSSNGGVIAIPESSKASSSVISAVVPGIGNAIPAGVQSTASVARRAGARKLNEDGYSMPCDDWTNREVKKYIKARVETLNSKIGDLCTYHTAFLMNSMHSNVVNSAGLSITTGAPTDQDAINRVNNEIAALESQLKDAYARRAELDPDMNSNFPMSSYVGIGISQFGDSFIELGSSSAADKKLHPEQKKRARAGLDLLQASLQPSKRFKDEVDRLRKKTKKRGTIAKGDVLVVKSEL